jgi:hypothetical protein
MRADLGQRKIGRWDCERGNFREQVGMVVERYRLVALASRLNDARKANQDYASHGDIIPVEGE